MKLSTCLACAALLLSASAYAQTSQTFTFGEGQTTPHATNARPSQGAQPQHAQSQPKAKPKHATKHHKRRPRYVSNPDIYSHS
ncbi:hypothetical protein [Paraburkholderia phenazinium]|jgi:hypothetical protein|uniref:Uncharacterized protein n=1 Tax=Paraburkholderia phenazinium TaxID=60549 RepID=A0A1G8G5A3_9BURK|nr:hypothetical protein [Paraburkholderia phenazinium]SDH89451.1 hypothetical protein SAMN05216466_114134 [Paraburkholderia phenazinium]